MRKSQTWGIKSCGRSFRFRVGLPSGLGSSESNSTDLARPISYWTVYQKSYRLERRLAAAVEGRIEGSGGVQEAGGRHMDMDVHTGCSV